MYTYIEKIRDRHTGLIYTINHKCEIIKEVGEKMVQIRIYGTFYHNRPNATPTVAKKSILELSRSLTAVIEHQASRYPSLIRMPYKD